MWLDEKDIEAFPSRVKCACGSSPSTTVLVGLVLMKSRIMSPGSRSKGGHSAVVLTVRVRLNWYRRGREVEVEVTWKGDTRGMCTRPIVVVELHDKHL